MFSIPGILVALGIAAYLRLLYQRSRRSYPEYRTTEASTEQLDPNVNTNTNDGTFGAPAAPSDIRLVRAFLKHLGLPTEIVLQILDFADYRPEFFTQSKQALRLVARANGSSEAARPYLTSKAIPIGNKRAGIRHVPRKVTFKTKSNDQGWGGDRGCAGTYKGSWSWFEVTILRPSRDMSQSFEPLENLSLPPWRKPVDARVFLQRLGWVFVSDDKDEPISWRVQSNLTATGAPRDHEIVWEKGQPVETIDSLTNGPNGKGDGAGFYETYGEGDRLVLWARAKFPGWTNEIHEASIEIKYDEHQ